MRIRQLFRAVIFITCGSTVFISCLAISAPPKPFAAPAKLNALSRVQLSSELATRITDVRLRAGDRFKKGDLLARFDCTELQAELEGAESQRTLARRQLDANISLKQLGGNISELEMVQTEAQLAEATAKARVLRHRNSYCDVRAPFDGFVVARNVEPHQRAEVGTPLFELIDNRGLEVEAIIPSSWLEHLSIGDQFQVTINETGRVYSASLQRIVPVVDPVTRTVRVIGKIDQPEITVSADALLISGMSGEAQFALDTTADDQLANSNAGNNTPQQTGGAN